jgi:hypothetical protein
MGKIIQFPVKQVEQPKLTMKYEVGQKIYYTGDMANCEGWFEIAAIVNNPYCKGYDLREIGGKGRIFKSVYEIGIGDTYNGNCSKRFVTEEAYKKFKEQQLKAIQEAAAKFREKHGFSLV